MDRSEEEELDDAALQLVRFLGEVYVNLQEVQAVEEYVCEQYKASIRFLSRCTRSSSKDLRETSLPSSNGTGLAREQPRTDPDDDKTSKDLAALCEYLDRVLAAAQAVRENCNGTTHIKRRVKLPEPKVAGYHENPVVAKRVPGSGSSVKGSKTVEKGVKVSILSTTGDKMSNPKLTTSSIALRKTLKLPTSLVRGTPRARNKMQSKKTHTVIPTDQKFCCVPPEASDSRRLEEELTVKSTANFRTAARCPLQFPEKYCALRGLFKSTEVYWMNAYAVSRTKSAPEEAFMSSLDDVNHQEEYSRDDEYKSAALPIRDLQNVMEDLAHRTSVFDMLCLHRLAPAGSKIEETRNYSMHYFLPPKRKCVRMVTELEPENLVLVDVSNSSWLPQRCCLHLSQILSSRQLEDLSAEEMEQSIVTYSEPEQLLVIARLSHCIQVVLFNCYFEEVIGPRLLRRNFRSRKREEQDLGGLLRCKLAHSLLCKDGRNLFALAERITATD